MPQDTRGRLLGRRREQETLDALLRDVREGRSRALVLRGEPGIGKTALLDHLARRAAPLRVVRAAGVEAESDFAYSAVHSLCAPLLPGLDRLPPVQQEALRVALGLSAGNPPEMLLVGLAVLGLFAEAAAESPLVCLVDDAQWLDLMSQRILAFVARRLDAESVALVFAERVGDAADEGGSGLAGLPVLGLGGLDDADARTLLDSALPGPVDDRVRDRILAESGGNPLALLELPGGPVAAVGAELAFGFGGPGAASPVTRVEADFRRRVEALPADTRTLLLAAAVEPVGDAPLLGHALRLLDVGPESAAPAEAAGLLKPGAPTLRFRHPLARSAVWRGADAAALRAVHGALAEATDAGRDPDRRAWHLAHAAPGPDEQVADALERSADRALARGGRSAAAAFLERAAALSPEPKDRARRALAAAAAHLAAGVPGRVPDLVAAAESGPEDPLRQADAVRLRAQASYLAGSGTGGARQLLAATDRFRHLDEAAARETCLSALEAAVTVGRADPHGVRQVVEAARALPPGDDATGLFLRAFVTWSTDGPDAAIDALRLVLGVFAADCDPAPLWAAAAAALELGDLRTCLDITDRATARGQATGTYSIVRTASAYRAVALAHAGQLAEAGDLIAQTAAVEEAVGLSPSPIAAAVLGAYRGEERSAISLIDALERDGEQRGRGRLLGVADCARALLHNGLGNYPLALAAARRALAYEDFAVHRWAASELAEAAARTGEHAAAADACDRLAGWARAGTPWAAGAYALAQALASTEQPAERDEATERDEMTETRYREAIDHFGRGGLAVFQARARLLLGEWLRRQNRPSDARAELRAAHEAADKMGLDAFAQRARRELSAAGETVRGAHRSEGEPVLTPQEAQIGRLAAAGHSNAEIGARLFLSPRTVEWHLRKVFTKLGISSRRELDGALPAR